MQIFLATGAGDGSGGGSEIYFTVQQKSVYFAIYF